MNFVRCTPIVGLGHDEIGDGILSMTEYGPFHRKKSNTQTYVDARLQVASGEIWGKPIKHGGKFPYVKAYLQPLCFGLPAAVDCADAEGIEFTTLVKPSVRMPTGQILWGLEAEPRPSLRAIDDETIALTVTITKVVYVETQADEYANESS